MPIADSRRSEIQATADADIDTSDIPEADASFFQRARRVPPRAPATAAPIPTVSVTYARTGASAKANELGMRPMQARAYDRRGEQYLLIKSPPAPGKTRARFSNLIAAVDASDQAVAEAVNDTLKAIAASLLMEQVLAPRFDFKTKTPASGPAPDHDYGEGGYDPAKCNVGFKEESGAFQIEIKSLAEPKSEAATRVCRSDLNEVIAAFAQDRTAIERGLFDSELVPEELTQLRMGKIVKDRYPNLDAADQEAVRQHAIAALNLIQRAKAVAAGGGGGAGGNEVGANTAFVDGVRKYVTDVRELDIDLIDRINPFGEAYAILAKTLSEESLGRLAAVIAARRTSLSPDEARDLAGRAVHFKKERGRLPSFTAADPKAGEFFVLGGQFVHVAAVVEEFVATYGRPDARPRVTHDNGTESDLLIRSLQRALYKDETGRRVTDPSPGPLFSQLAEDHDLESGTIYVLRSLSDHPYVAAHRDLIHKIGVTGGDVASRIAHAARDATYLLAAVEVMATWRLYNVNRAKLETLLHRVFAPARLDLVIQDRFGRPVQPREWYLAPLPAIEDAVNRVIDGSITDYTYDPATAALARANPVG